MKIKNPQSQEEGDIYSAKLKFTKERNGQVSKEMVRVTIRYGIKGPTRKKDLQVPDNINTFNLNWTKYGGKPISVYHRRNKDDYVDNVGMIVHTDLCQKLENLVSEICFEKTQYTK